MSTHPMIRRQASDVPVARVLPLLGVPHLDREFDYLVPEQLDDHAQPGCRVRVRFSGRLVDAYLIARVAESSHDGELAWIERVTSPEQVLTPQLWALVNHVARRWMGVRSDVLRLAIPPRHAAAEKSVPAPTNVHPQPTLGPVYLPPEWSDHPMAASFLSAALAGAAPRAVWTSPPARDWVEAIAALADSVYRRGQQVLLIVPDQRDIERVAAACRRRADHKNDVADLSASLGPQARYRRWLMATRGHARIVVGTRSAVFTPLPEPGLMVVHDDGDDSYVEPRAPYPHTRDVAIARSHLEGVPLLFSSPDRTPEVAVLVRSGWAPEIQPRPALIRSLSPRVVAVSDLDPRQARDVAGGHTRLPAVAISMARQALDRDEPVLIQVPRRGYINTLLCGHCRTPARCRRCHGPVRSQHMDPVRGPIDLACRWCGAPETRFRCVSCGSTALRAGVIGSTRTAEEMGRMFPGVQVLTSTASTALSDIETGPSLVISTPGVEPVAAGGYGSALLLDSWALLGRDDLRAVQDALRTWVGAASLVRPADQGGTVFLSADANLPVSQALIRWDLPGWADRELDDRFEVGFPPAVHMIAIDGSADTLADVVTELDIPDGVEMLGPVELPATENLPGQHNIDEPERLLLRVRPGVLDETTAAVRAYMVGRSTRRGVAPLRVRLDPVHIG